jgi:hypothetical protein
MVLAKRGSSEPWRTRLIVSSRSSLTALLLFRGICGRSTASTRRAFSLLPCFAPSSAARLGSACRAHCVAPVTAQAPQRLPFLFFAEHRLDIVQFSAICRFPPFNGT